MDWAWTAEQGKVIHGQEIDLSHALGVYPDSMNIAAKRSAEAHPLTADIGLEG
jgi:hypothetical protein